MLKKVVEKKILSKFEHALINDIIKNPTAENMVIWMWNEIKNINKLFEEEITNNDNNYLKKYIDGDIENLDLVKPDCVLYEIKLWETDTSFVTYR
jgi:6-pyruvoyltetrahydropterin/6-carboxytetrahydropterin synthase